MSFDGQAEQWQPCGAEACRGQPRHPWMTCPNYWVEWEWIQPGGWRASIRAGELQIRFHQPREAGVVIDLGCGRCGKRTLDRLVANPDFPEAQSIWGGSSELRQRAKALRDQRTGRLGKPVRGAVAVPSIQRDWMGRTAPEPASPIAPPPATNATAGQRPHGRRKVRANTSGSNQMVNSV